MLVNGTCKMIIRSPPRLLKSLSPIVFVALFSLSLFAGENRWTINGPEAGSATRIVFDPADSSIVYAATSNGVFRSSDGGQHWTAAAGLLGTPFSDLAVATNDPQKVFAASVYGLYKSSNRGVTWSVVHPFGSSKVAVSTDGNVVSASPPVGPSGHPMAESHSVQRAAAFLRRFLRSSSIRRTSTSFTRPLP